MEKSFEAYKFWPTGTLSTNNIWTVMVLFHATPTVKEDFWFLILFNLFFTSDAEHLAKEIVTTLFNNQISTR